MRLAAAHGREPSPPMKDVIDDDLAFAANQYAGLLARVRGDPGLPRAIQWGSGFVVCVQAKFLGERWIGNPRQYCG